MAHVLRSPLGEKTINQKHANPANNLHKTENHFTAAEAAFTIREILFIQRRDDDDMISIR